MSAIVFDLDGTLIHSLPDIHAAANSVMAGIGAAPFSEAEARSFIGSGTPVFVERMIAARGLDPADHGRLLEAFMGLYEDAVTLTELYPGVRDALAALAARGHPLGLCTNKPIGPTRAVLRHFDLEAQFGAVLGGNSLPERKPHPRPLEETYRLLGAAPLLYVGDSDVDAATAQAAGVTFALYTEGYRAEPVDALPHDFAFSDFAVLPEYVASLAG